MGNVLLLASGKGGSGKSTFAVNLGYAFAAKKKRTLLLDMNIGLRNLDIYTGLQDKVLFDLGDYFSGTCKLAKALVQSDDDENLYLLSCPQFRGIDGLTDQHIRMLFSKLRGSFDWILVDAPAGIGSDFCRLTPVCDKALVVLTMDYVSLRKSDTVNRRLESLGVEERYYAINRVTPLFWESNKVPSAEAIQSVMKTDLAGIVPEDPAIHAGNNLGTPACLDEKNYIHQTFADIAARIAE